MDDVSKRLALGQATAILRAWWQGNITATEVGALLARVRRPVERRVVVVSEGDGGVSESARRIVIDMG